MLSYATISAILSTVSSGAIGGAVIRLLSGKAKKILTDKLAERREKIEEAQANRLAERLREFGKKGDA